MTRPQMSRMVIPVICALLSGPWAFAEQDKLSSPERFIVPAQRADGKNTAVLHRQTVNETHTVATAVVLDYSSFYASITRARKDIASADLSQFMKKQASLYPEHYSRLLR